MNTLIRKCAINTNRLNISQHYGICIKCSNKFDISGGKYTELQYTNMNVTYESYA